MTGAALYRTIWRWHFYAGLFVVPFIVVLALSGSIYLFKPQVERWEELAFLGQPAAAPVAPHEQLSAALAAYPGASLLDYRLPREAGDAAMVRLAGPQQGRVREVFVSPGGEVLGEIDPDSRIMATVKRVHGELLIGNVGNVLVELAACWAIVMILSGLYLWWPRGRGPVGVVWPRLRLSGRAFWRDLHAVIGFWISALALVLLVSGLPWAGVWGKAFDAVRAEMGWVKGPAQWDIDGGMPAAEAGGHHGHGHHQSAPAAIPGVPFDARVFDQMVADARAEQLVFPAIVTPPGAPGRFGAPGQMLWTIRSDAQNAPLRVMIKYDMSGRSELSRETFYDGHPIDRVVGYGIAWHEGQLFGLANQLIGLATALGLVMLVISGTVMWLRRRPAASLGAPPRADPARHPRWVAGAVVVLAALLPLFALSLAGIWLIERIALSRVEPLARWMGLRAARG